VAEAVRIKDRLARAATMSRRELVERIREKLIHRFSYRATIRRLAFGLDRYSRALYDAPYRERAETGPLNLAVKLDRQRLGGPFESPLIVLINRAAAALVGDRRTVLEVGSGTGLFAWLAAENDRCSIVASELDAPARQWAIEHRSRPNIRYCDQPLADFEAHGFELVVALEVLEHIADFGAFLSQMTRIAPAAIVSTPNKWSDPFRSIARTPAYGEHVREWTAGEFLWVLRAFYSHVELFTIPDAARQAAAVPQDHTRPPRVVPCTDLSCEEPLLAWCENRDR
jgi:2-polyprenyl-3-methyl-5-hydroxy-6-metoxy-1,4-benzoquinol methylase